jgi:hypothetical protein
LPQPYPQFTGGFNVFDNTINHHGLQLIFKRHNQGLGFQFGYTYSLSKDNRSWDPALSGVTTGSVQSASSTPFDLRDRNLNYAWSDFDRRHVFQGTYTYDLPFGKGRRYLSNAPAIVDQVLGGWFFAGTVILMSGRPFTVYSGVNTLSNVVQSTADCTGCSRDIGQLTLESGKNFGFDSATRALFSTPAPGSIGNTAATLHCALLLPVGRPLSKKFKITEGQLRPPGRCRNV